MLKIGIDTGGTCTDAVIFDTEKEQILARAKAPTSHHALEIGIGEAIDALPQDLVGRADQLALSTTLATNACVEGKGGRVRLVYLGVNRRVVERTYRDYGFTDMESMIFAEGDPKRGIEPDYAAILDRLEEEKAFFDSLAIAQINPDQNDAAYEKALRDKIKERESLKNLPIVCAYELYQDLNAVKRGATAYLNARLLPIIARFLDAIHCALEERRLTLPLVIMRSDGSLMSEAYAKKHPVETLLCGPAASLKGGRFLMKEAEKSAVIVDMGGTTTDIALVKAGQPVYAERGIEIGSWKTFVQGLYVHTLGLGGDTEVTYGERGLELSTQRVVSTSALIKRFPDLLSELVKLNADNSWGHTRPLYSYVLLQRMDYEKVRFDQEENSICQLLQKGPMSIGSLAEAVGRDPYTLNLKRLEREGIVIRSGLTPTDLMCAKGQLPLYDKAGAIEVLSFVAHSVKMPVEEVENKIFDLVCRRMYENIAQVILENRYGDHSTFAYSPEIACLIRDQYDRMDKLCGKKEEEKEVSPELGRMTLGLNARLVGVGAPTHCFLPEVASRFGVECLIPEEAGVANAIGAIIGDVRGSAMVRIEAVSVGYEEETTFRIYTEEGSSIWPSYEEALDRAKAYADKLARERALDQGADRILRTEWRVKKKTAPVFGSEMFLGAELYFDAIGRL